MPLLRGTIELEYFRTLAKILQTTNAGESVAGLNMVALIEPCDTYDMLRKPVRSVPELTFERRMHAQSSSKMFIGYQVVEVFSIRPHNCSDLYVGLPAWLNVDYEPNRFLPVPNPDLFAYNFFKLGAY